MAESKRDVVLRWAKRLFTPIAVAFLVYFAWHSRDVLVSLIEQASVGKLVIAAVIWGALHLFMPVLAVVILRGAGADISWRQAFATHVERLPARYVPGGVWHTVGRVMDYHEQGVESKHLTVFVVLENGLAAAFTLAVGGAILWASNVTGGLGALVPIGCLAGMAGLFALHYFTRTISTGTYLKALGVTAVFWLIATAAFITYLGAFPLNGNVVTDTLVNAGVYLFSWGVGFLAVFAPQGIGVFEAVASDLIGSPIGFMGFAALIAGFRVVVMVADFATWGLYRLLAKN